jgi:beta-lactamase regulating signal transducer with metallopeptidase domain
MNAQAWLQAVGSLRNTDGSIGWDAATGAWVEAATGTWLAWLPAALLQTTIVSLLVILLCRAGKRLSSPLRYALVCVALLKFLMPPTLAMPLGFGSWIPAVPALAALESAGTAGDARVATDQPRRKDLATSAETDQDPVATARLAIRDGGETASSRNATTPPGTPPVAAWLLLLHLSGSLAVVVWVARQQIRIRSLVRRCEPISDAHLRSDYRRECRRAGLRRAPELLESPDELGPVAVGLWRRRIILPAAAVRRLPAGRLRPILAHELAHHRRGDLWIDALALGLALAWWFHPAFWLVVRELRRTREDCCDEAVLAGGATSRACYCQLLLDVARAVAGRRARVAPLLNGSLTHPLARRIQRMMSSSFSPTGRLSARGAIVVVGAALLLLPGSQGVAAHQEEAPDVPAPVAVAPSGAEVFSRFLTRPPVLTPGAEPEESLQVAAELEPVGSGSESAGGVGSQLWRRWFGEDPLDHLDRDDVDRLVARGLDRAFIEAQIEQGDRTVDIAQLRAWAVNGVDAGLVDELDALGIDEIEVSELFRLVRLEVDRAYIAALRQLGYERLTVSELTRLARYEIDAAFIASFRQVGYEGLTVDELVQLNRYGVAPAYAGGLQDTGYNELSANDLVTLTRYEVDAGYVASLSALGYDALEVEELVRLRRYDVDIEFIETLGDLGPANLSVDDLVTLSRYEVDPEFIVGINAAGYQDLSVEDLVRLKRYGVELATMARLQELQFAALSIDDIVTLHRYEVDLDYITAMRQLGVAAPAVGDLVSLQRYGVGPTYVAALAEAGYDELDAEDLVRLRRYEVEASYLTDLAAAGLRELSVDEIVTLERYGVSVEYLAGLAAVGYGELSVEEVVRLHRYEVEPEFIGRLQAAGFEDLTIDRIIRLKRAG